MIEFLRKIAKVIVKTIMIFMLIVASPLLLGAFIVEFSKGDERVFIDFIKDIIYE